mmetsp:Transcript_42688/g.129672  ORF Transcript_42688/g.129672 Transcript_42688/m.129672 type:complete len:236 (+) Transcript_42688:1637-2344(+)
MRSCSGMKLPPISSAAIEAKRAGSSPPVRHLLRLSPSRRFSITLATFLCSSLKSFALTETVSNNFWQVAFSDDGRLSSSSCSNTSSIILVKSDINLFTFCFCCRLKWSLPPLVGGGGGVSASSSAVSNFLRPRPGPDESPSMTLESSFSFVIIIVGVTKSGMTFCQKLGSSTLIPAVSLSPENLLLLTIIPDLLSQELVFAPSTTLVRVLFAKIFSMSSAQNSFPISSFSSSSSA